MRSSFELREIMLYFLLDWIASLQSRPDTVGLSLPCIHSLAEDGSQVDTAADPLLSAVWSGEAAPMPGMQSTSSRVIHPQLPTALHSSQKMK